MSKYSSPALPATDPIPAANVLAILSRPPANDVIAFNTFVCGKNAAMVPITGPAIPEKSARSPVFKLKLFSSMTVFRLTIVPSCSFLCCTGNPKSCKPCGVKAT